MICHSACSTKAKKNHPRKTFAICHTLQYWSLWLVAVTKLLGKKLLLFLWPYLCKRSIGILKRKKFLTLIIGYLIHQGCYKWLDSTASSASWKSLICQWVEMKVYKLLSIGALCILQIGVYILGLTNPNSLRNQLCSRNIAFVCVVLQMGNWYV